MNFLQSFVDEKKKNKPASQVQIFDLKLSTIVPDPDQVRKNFPRESLDELAASIRVHGLQSPIHVYPDNGQYVILTGERRYRAVQSLGEETIKAIVHETKPDVGTIRIVQLIENLQRENLSAIDTAKALKNLSYGLTQRQIAENIGISESQVSKALKIMTLPEDWLREIEKKCSDVSIKELYEIAKQTDLDVRQGMYDRLVGNIADDISGDEPATEQPAVIEQDDGQAEQPDCHTVETASETMSEPPATDRESVHLSHEYPVSECKPIVSCPCDRIVALETENASLKDRIAELERSKASLVEKIKELEAPGQYLDKLRRGD